MVYEHPHEKYINEITYEIENKKREREQNIFAKISPKVKFVIGIAIVVAVYMYVKTGDIKIPVLVVGGAIFIVLFMQQGNLMGGPLSEQQLKIMLYSHLKKKQLFMLGDHYEIKGKVRILPQGRTKFLDHKPWRYECGFMVIKDNGLNELYAAELNPYTGDMIGITHRPMGYTGSESPDIEVIKDPRLRDELRYQKELGVRRYKERM